MPAAGKSYSRGSVVKAFLPADPAAFAHRLLAESRTRETLNPAFWALAHQICSIFVIQQQSQAARLTRHATGKAFPKGSWSLVTPCISRKQSISISDEKRTPTLSFKMVVGFCASPGTQTRHRSCFEHLDFLETAEIRKGRSPWLQAPLERESGCYRTTQRKKRLCRRWELDTKN